MNPRMAVLLLSVLLSAACSDPAGRPESDDRFIVLGPSLVELMHVCGFTDRIVGTDRYAAWPPTLDAADIGGYLDPSLEGITALNPTSIHIVGQSPDLVELAASLGVPVHSYRFDTLDDIFSSLDSLSARYGGDAGAFRNELEARLDSIARSIEDRGAGGASVMIVVYHEQGASSMTIAGGGTFFDGILRSMDCSLSAPAAGSWPMISAEGVLELSPDVVICLNPGAADSLAVRQAEKDYWGSLGFARDRVFCLFQSYLLIPGGRLAQTAERISECLPSR